MTSCTKCKEEVILRPAKMQVECCTKLVVGCGCTEMPSLNPNNRWVVGKYNPDSTEPKEG